MSKESQRDKILRWLQKRGSDGVMNWELNNIAFRYGGRIHELRKRGWEIETKREAEGLFRFILRGKT